MSCKLFLWLRKITLECKIQENQCDRDSSIASHFWKSQIHAEIAFEPKAAHSNICYHKEPKNCILSFPHVGVNESVEKPGMETCRTL